MTAARFDPLPADVIEDLDRVLGIVEDVEGLDVDDDERQSIATLRLRLTDARAAIRTTRPEEAPAP